MAEQGVANCSMICDDTVGKTGNTTGENTHRNRTKDSDTECGG